MNGQEDTTVLGFIKKNLFPLISLLVVVGNVWIAYQLSPVLARIGQVEVRATALETRMNVDEAYIPRFISIESLLPQMDKRLERIESLLDRVYGLGAK